MRLSFPAAFRPPAFASWVVLFPPRNRAFLTVCLPDTGSAPDPDGVSTFSMSESRPGWALPLPRGRWCSPDRHIIPGRHLPFRNGQPLVQLRYHYPSRSSR